MIDDIINKFDSHFAAKNDLGVDLGELEEISQSLPKDNVFSVEDCFKLQRKILHGMKICDDWIPVLHIMVSSKESEKDRAKSIVYANPPSKEGQKLTIDLRKALADLDEGVDKLKIEVEKLKAMKLFFEKKRDSLKSALFMFKDQVLSFRFSDSNVYMNRKEDELWNE